MVWCGKLGVEGVVMFQCLRWNQKFYWERLFIIKLVISCGFFVDVKALYSSIATQFSTRMLCIIILYIYIYIYTHTYTLPTVQILLLIIYVYYIIIL